MTKIIESTILEQISAIIVEDQTIVSIKYENRIHRDNKIWTVIPGEYATKHGFIHSRYSSEHEAISVANQIASAVLDHKKIVDPANKILLEKMNSIYVK